MNWTINTLLPHAAVAAMIAVGLILLFDGVLAQAEINTAITNMGGR